jgi:hypothetical protein
MMKFATVLVIAALLALSNADLYLHNPRGWNDRCDEKSNDRDNDQRGWNSNNDAAGGYSYCDGEMHFYEGSTLHVEWYSQHSCGNGAKVTNDPTNPYMVTCQHVLQLGCDWTLQTMVISDPSYLFTDGISLGRPGADIYNTVADPDPPIFTDYFNTFGDTCTETRPLTALSGPNRDECGTSATNNAQCETDLSQGTNTFNSDTCTCHPRKMQTYMQHEPEDWYIKCGNRQRNMGLFTADQNVNNNNGAHNTRQEPNSARYGYECTEERDYWPYWHPTPWIDLAVYTSDISLCSLYQTYSQNVMDKCECVTQNNDISNMTAVWAAQSYNQQIFCENNNFFWNCTGNKWNWPKPQCYLAPAQTDNRLGNFNDLGGNAPTGGSRGQMLAFYDWTIPKLSGGLFPNPNGVRCLLRLRYNITAGEVKFNYDQTNNNAITTNPVKSFGAGNYSLPANVTMPLRHAVNTAQYGRTFEDRTHIFSIVPRSQANSLDGVTDNSFQTATVWNLNVRGKRGNIAQVRNCVEYDFVPNILYASVGDFVHFQYCMSDYNDNGNAGEGLDGTDRANMVPVSGSSYNLLIPMNQTANGAPQLNSAYGGQMFSMSDWSSLAFLNQDPMYCDSSSNMMNNNDDGNTVTACQFLNGVRNMTTGLPTSYFSHVAKVLATGNLEYICSRNNNFTNRSQKGVISVSGIASAGVIAGAVVGSVVGASAIAVAGFFIVKKGGVAACASRV